MRPGLTYRVFIASSPADTRAIRSGNERKSFLFLDIAVQQKGQIDPRLPVPNAPPDPGGTRFIRIAGTAPGLQRPHEWIER